MAERHQLVKCSPDQVWRILASGDSYARWVVGTQRILSVDAAWPAVGAELCFQAGVGPLRITDSCVVRISEPEHRLELEAMADPFGTARIAFTLSPWRLGPGARLQGAVSERLLHMRNRRLLDNLARVAVTDRPSP